MSDSDIEEEPRIDLVEPISRSALMGEDGVTFSVSNRLNRDDFLLASRPEDEFDPEILLKNVNLDVLNIEDATRADCPFDSIKLKMTSVYGDGLVMKRVKRQGYGDVVAPDSIVTIHYNGYTEMEEVPFDSSTLRGKPETFTLGEGPLLGLNIAIATMRKEERAEFILHPSVAYGKFGCAPRIPGNAEVLFDVELLNVRVGVAAALQDKVSREENVGWENVQKVVKAHISSGVASFKKKQFKESMKTLELAKKFLTDCRLKNEEEEDSQKCLLLKVCTNLAIVYNKLHDHASYPPKAILNCKDALKIDPKQYKVYLQWGLALITLGDYSKARHYLSMAKEAFPHDDEIKRAFEKLEAKIKREKAAESEMWKKALKLTENKEEKVVKRETSPEYEALVEMFEDLKNDSEKLQIVLPPGISPQEHDDILELADKFGFYVEERDNSLCVKKPN